MWSNISNFIRLNLILTFVVDGVRTAVFFVGRNKINLLLVLTFVRFQARSFPPERENIPLFIWQVKHVDFSCFLLPLSFKRGPDVYLSFNIRCLDSFTGTANARFYSQ